MKSDANLFGKDADGFKKSFASVVTDGLVIPSVQNQPMTKGSYVAVKVDKRALQERLESFKHSLIARIVFSKGDKPWILNDLKDKLSSIWKISNWRLISLSKGCYQVVTSTAEDKAKVWGLGSINLKPGILRLQQWTLWFKPSEQKTTNVQVWVRMHELPVVFWHPKILCDIVRSIGVPLKIDHATISGDYGHYARILVDIDLSKPVLKSVAVEMDEETRFVNLEYERLPHFCSTCKSIGHLLIDCYHNKKAKQLSKKVEAQEEDITTQEKNKEAVHEETFLETRNGATINEPIADNVMDEATRVDISKNDKWGDISDGEENMREVARVGDEQHDQAVGDEQQEQADGDEQHGQTDGDEQHEQAVPTAEISSSSISPDKSADTSDEIEKVSETSESIQEIPAEVNKCGW